MVIGKIWQSVARYIGSEKGGLIFRKKTLTCQISKVDLPSGLSCRGNKPFSLISSLNIRIVPLLLLYLKNKFNGPIYYLNYSQFVKWAIDTFKVNQADFTEILKQTVNDRIRLTSIMGL